MNIVYATDDRYAEFCGISMFSLLANNKDLPQIRVFILDNHISEENKEKLLKTAAQFDSPAGTRSVVFIDVADFQSRFKFAFNTSGYNPIVLSRLFLPEYLPEDVDFVLYLDCDIIVAGSLSPLEKEYRPERADVGMVPELYMPPAKKKESVGFGPKDTYYNAGVLWINLKRWREEKLTEKFLSFYASRNGQLLYNDQDIINYCCRGRILQLPQWFNTNTNLPYFPRWFLRHLQPQYICEPRSEYRKRLKNPVIIHYQGDERPWIRGSRNYYRGFYEEYEKKSLWGTIPRVRGREWYMMCYHILNIGTRILPPGRVLFTNVIGINKIRWFGKS
jgi:lipopolysaccharide biosynthesis glycosyltransferase